MPSLLAIDLSQSTIPASKPNASRSIPIGVDFLSPICSILLVTLLRRLRRRSDECIKVAKKNNCEMKKVKWNINVKI